VKVRNITLALDEELLRQARHKAVDQGLSLSGYVAKILQEQVAAGGTEVEAARKRLLARMERGYENGFSGRLPFTREELHRRGFDTGEQPRAWELDPGPNAG